MAASAPIDTLFIRRMVRAVSRPWPMRLAQLHLALENDMGQLGGLEHLTRSRPCMTNLAGRESKKA